MHSVREILERNNIKLDISEPVLDLGFERDFILREAGKVKNSCDYHPNEFALAYFFHEENNENNRLKIVPCDSDYPNSKLFELP